MDALAPHFLVAADSDLVQDDRLDGGHTKKNRQEGDDVATPLRRARHGQATLQDLRPAKGREPVEESTLRKYRLHARIIQGKVGDVKLSGLTPFFCDGFRDDLLAEYSRKYAKKILGSFKAILSQARTDGRLLSDPTENTVILISKRRLQSEPTPMPSLEEVRLLLSQALTFHADKDKRIARAWRRFHPFFLLLAHSGVRPGEAIGLPWKNVDFETSAIRVTQDATEDRRIGLPKSAAAYRTIYMPETVMAELAKWKITCPEGPEDLVFPTWKGTVESLSNFTNRGWYVLQRACGLVDAHDKPRYPLKSLRHVRASLEIHNGATAKELQMLMGHSSVQITFDVYGHLFKDHEEDRAQRAKVIAQQLAGCGDSVARPI